VRTTLADPERRHRRLSASQNLHEEVVESS
jgi:hypothetical protein